MRKVIALDFITLDGVIQGGGGPEEDTSGGFEYGGWYWPYDDDFTGEVLKKQMSLPFDLLLGRKTFDICSSRLLLFGNPNVCDLELKFLDVNSLSPASFRLYFVSTSENGLPI